MVDTTVPAARSRHQGRLALPRPPRDGAVSVEEALRRRRSVREYSATPLTLEHLGALLWAAQGISGGGLRTAPSAGATYPLELAVVAGRVTSLAPGAYRYDPLTHSVTSFRPGNHLQALATACGKQAFVAQAPVAVVIGAVQRRCARVYGARGRRYVDQEVGCAAENLALAAVALGLGTVMIGAIDEAEVARVAGLEPEVEPLCVMPIGRPWRT